jgi:hypothetical protein
MLSQAPYEMSFSTGGLFLSESVKLAQSHQSLGEWDRVREQALLENLLQVRTRSPAFRVLREVISRLKCLTTDESALLLEGDSQEQRVLLWIAVCRRYTFTGEFAVEVLRERFLPTVLTPLLLCSLSSAKLDQCE